MSDKREQSFTTRRGFTLTRDESEYEVEFETRARTPGALCLVFTRGTKRSVEHHELRVAPGWRW